MIDYMSTKRSTYFPAAHRLLPSAVLVTFDHSFLSAKRHVLLMGWVYLYSEVSLSQSSTILRFSVVRITTTA